MSRINQLFGERRRDQGDAIPDGLSIASTDHPLQRLLKERPEVYEVGVYQCDGHLRVLVTFDGWAMPARFPGDYDLSVEEFYVRDPRPLWKQIIGIGGGPRLAVAFKQEQGDLPDSLEGGESR